MLLVLIVAQLVLPGIAASRLRDQLSRSGTVLSVKVSAFPAIELLWGQADSVVVRMGRYQAGASEIGSKLGGAADVGTLDVSAQEVQSGLLTVRDARLRKQGDELIGTAVVRQADLRAAAETVAQHDLHDGQQRRGSKQQPGERGDQLDPGPWLVPAGPSTTLTRVAT